jgi:hypothetical protein
MTLKPWLFVLAAAAILIAGCATSRIAKANNEDGEIVIAEGIAPYKADDLPGTKAASLAAAQRSAVELVVGVYVNAKTRVEKAVAIEQNILANTSGYVKRYEILSQGRDGEWYKTKIRALVSTQQIHEELDSLGLLKQPAVGYPRVAVRLQEFVGDHENKEGHAAHALTQALLNKGFKVMDLPVSVKPDEDPVEAARAIRPGEAELLVAGMARAQDLGYGGNLGGMSSFRASISFRVIEAGSGEVVATVSQVASGMEATPDIAAGKALEKAGEAASNDLSNLPQELLKRSHVDLTLSGLKSFEKLSSFEKSLSAEPGVKDFFLRSYSQGSGVAVLDVLIDAIGPQELANRAVKIGGSDWSVFQVSGRSVQLSASQAGR